MFLPNLLSQNPAFAEAAIALHQAGDLPPDTYVLDLDMLGANAKGMCAEAHRLGMSVIAMTKQFGRNPLALATLRDNGVDSFVAVDLYGARAIHRAGQPIGNVGHLVQIPRHAAREVAAMAPHHWTVFSEQKAREAASAAKEVGRRQLLLARIYGEDGMVVESHAGGFEATEVVSVAERLGAVPGSAFGGITSYPALVFDKNQHKIHATTNLHQLERSAGMLRDAGWKDVAVNAPGETSTVVLSTLANAGVTEVEPGHGFTATGGYFAYATLPEKPAMLYLSEVSHLDGETAFCFGGGLYLCIGSVDYQPHAAVGRDLDTARRQQVPATLSQNHQVIDFYGRLEQTAGTTLSPGDSVLFCFRAQAFYTRSHVAPVSGIQSGHPKVEGIYTVEGVRI